MGRFLVLIYGSEPAWDAMTPDEERALDEGHGAFVAAAAPGVIGGGALAPSATTVTLRGDAAGRPTATDGPFLETKEALGGFYLLEAEDLAAAVALARRLPEIAMGHCGIEVRPLRGSH
jgi:hypothetical protein